jgi:hypothetical protein
MITSVYFAIDRILRGDSFDAIKGQLSIDDCSMWYGAAAGASQVAAQAMPCGDARVKSLQTLEQHIADQSRRRCLIATADEAIARIKGGEAFCEIRDLIRLRAIDVAAWESSIQAEVWSLPSGAFDTSTYATELRELQGFVHKYLCAA